MFSPPYLIYTLSSKNWDLADGSNFKCLVRSTWIDFR